MRLFTFFLRQFWFLLRFALVVAPFPLMYFSVGPITHEFTRANYLLLWSPLWAVVSFLAFFSRELADSSLSGPVIAYPNNPHEDDEDVSRVDAITPGTAAYDVSNYGGSLDRINGD